MKQGNHMTRDKWLAKCAAQFRDKGGMETGEAAAYAMTMADTEVADNGLNPARWRDPVALANAELAGWDDAAE